MKEPFVADSSIALSWVIPTQKSALADGLLQEVGEGRRFVVPVLWGFEVANGLIALSRRKRISDEHCQLAIDILRRLQPVIDEDGVRMALAETSGLAVKYGLSVYDACYLELAARRRLVLATRDEALHKAAKEHGVKAF